MANHPPRVLFTAFEPSGDALAGPVIGRLHELCPALDVWALGGPRMEESGAQLIETTTGQATMFLAVLSQVRTHRQRVKRLRDWLREHRIDLLIPVDSPAANWSICRLVRDLQPKAGIVHLAAPQLWAWAPWRIHKLRRLTNHVLCLLPFEPYWFEQRGVKASFVGHPVYPPTTPSDPRESYESRATETSSNTRHPIIALLPGSRSSEIRANWPTMLNVMTRLREDQPDLAGVVAAVDERAAGLIRDVVGRLLGDGGWPPWLNIEIGRVVDVLAASDVALVVSGTATLLCAAQRRPMVVIYYVNPWTWHLAGRWLMRTPYFALPNLIAGGPGGLGLGQAVTEFVPDFGQVEAITEELRRLVESPEACQEQKEIFDRITQSYGQESFSDRAARLCMPWIE